jgi:hypothetical protein
LSLLGSISKGPIDRPLRVIIYGQPGVGKSTFASQWPEPLFIDCEQRTSHLDVSRIEVKTWADILNIMREVLAADEAPCKTMVFDTLDHMEYLIHDHLCAAEKCESIEDYGGGYGKGYTATVDQWRKFAIGVEKLRNKGFNIVMLAHAHVKTFKNPLGEDYDKWQLKMNHKSANFLKEKCDALGFAHFEELILSGASKMDKAKVVVTDDSDRLLTFQHSAAYESKQGVNLPGEVPLDYTAFEEARNGTLDSE